MITIIQNRNTGKTRELLQTALDNNAIVLTSNKKGLQVKAKSYGFKNIEIISYEDLEKDSYSFNKPLLIHNCEKVIQYLFDRYYNLNVFGFSMTKEQDNE